MYNDKRTVLDEALSDHFYRPTTDTRVTIKHSDLFPLSKEVTQFLATVCLRARAVVESQVHLTPARTSTLPHFPEQPSWVRDVLQSHLGAKVGMGTRERYFFDEYELIRRWTRVLDRVRDGLNKEYTIADLRPRLFLEWLVEKQDADDGVIKNLARLKVLPGMVVGDEVWANSISRSENYRGALKTLLSDYPPMNLSSWFNSMVDSSDEEMRLAYQALFLKYVNESTTGGAVRSVFPKDAEKRPFEGWHKANEMKGYRKPMISSSKSIALHFGRFEKLVGYGDKGLWSAVKTLIHEASHKFAGTLDYAYIHQANYKTLTMPQAVNNADSFAFAAISNYQQKCVKETDLT